LGGTDAAAYANQPNVAVNSLLFNRGQGENFVYLLANSSTNAPDSQFGLGFGVLNQTNSSAYYSNLLIDGNPTVALFSTSF